MDNNSLDLLIFDGSFSLKALDDSGRFEGLAVPFGDADLSVHRDRFTAATEFGRSLKGGADLLYHHGLDQIDGEPNPLARTIIGEAEFKVVDAGVWMTGQMTRRNDYEAKVWEMVQKGKLGLSTGSAPHRADRIKNPDGTHTIKTWPIVEVSLTPTPAHPRTSVYELKTLIAPGEAAEPVGFLETLKRAEAALDWAACHLDLRDSKEVALKAVTEAATRYRNSRIDPEELQRGIDRLNRLRTRFSGSNHDVNQPERPQPSGAAAH